MRDRVEKHAHVLEDKGLLLLALGRGLGLEQALDVGVRRGDVQVAAEDIGQRLALLGRRLKAQQRAAVPLGEPGVAHGVEHILRQAQQAELVRHGRLRLAQPPRALLLAQAEEPDELRDAARLLEKVEVVALEVFHQRDEARLLEIQLHDDARHLTESRHARGAQAALPGHELIPALPRPHGQRAEHTVLGDAARELLELRRGKILPRLDRARRDRVHRQIHDAAAGRAAAMVGKLHSTPSISCVLQHKNNPHIAQNAAKSGARRKKEGGL